MDELFSCRNCIQNCGQSLNIGRGIGYCLHHNSIIRDPDQTTCKYLHRKDLPWFTVNEGRSEHAAEFSAYTGLVALLSKESIKSFGYSEKKAWEDGSFDSMTNALARYHLSSKKWIFIETLTAGIDGRRALAQASLTRRYMAHCDTWKSSFRLTLDVVSQLPSKPFFLEGDIYEAGGREEAVWDVVFSRLCLIQEYGWHAGLSDLTWITDAIPNLQDFAWETIENQLRECAANVIVLMLRHAQENDEYFSMSPRRGEDPGEEAPEVET